MFYTKSSLRLDLIVSQANKLLPEVRREIFFRNNQFFDMASPGTTAIDVAMRITPFFNSVDIEIVTYRPKWRWSRAYGYVTPGQPTKIFLNQYKLNRSTESIIGSLYHELMHCMDACWAGISIGHGNNSPVGKEDTCPYWVGREAKRLCSQ